MPCWAYIQIGMMKMNYVRDIKIFAGKVEKDALAQINALAGVEAYKNARVRIMPDCHTGAGCPIGLTMTIEDKVTPNLVGVDIGCGMLTIRLKEKNIDPGLLDEVIKRYIPGGFEVHKKPQAGFDLGRLKCKNAIDMGRASRAIGTLGGGNHFIEVGKNQKGALFLVVHSGSRHPGLQVANYYQHIAVRKISETSSGKGRHHQPAIKKDLAYLSGRDYEDYMHDMALMQEYASLNRRTIVDIILDHAGLHEQSSFETIHNYIDFDRMILRKGAVRAEKGEMLLIPLNMRDGSLICTGKGNTDWNYSAPHGAGRLMSRRKAKQKLQIQDFARQMRGIYTTSVTKATLDEAPGAYKPMEEIVETIGETVDILDRIKPVYNYKAH